MLDYVQSHIVRSSITFTNILDHSLHSAFCDWTKDGKYSKLSMNLLIWIKEA